MPPLCPPCRRHISRPYPRTQPPTPRRAPFVPSLWAVQPPYARLAVLPYFCTPHQAGSRPLWRPAASLVPIPSTPQATGTSARRHLLSMSTVQGRPVIAPDTAATDRVRMLAQSSPPSRPCTRGEPSCGAGMLEYGRWWTCWSGRTSERRAGSTINGRAVRRGARLRASMHASFVRGFDRGIATARA